MSNTLLFFISAEDQARINPASIEVTDEFLDHTHALKVSFTITDPENGAPQIRLLWPGRMDFRAAPEAPGALPAPAQIDFTPSAYNGWRTVGVLRLKALDKDARAIRQTAGDLEVVPNCVWYCSVKLSEPFLFSAVGSALGSHIIDFHGNDIESTSNEYAQNAVSWFLQGKYGPVVNGAQRAALPMPAVEMTSTGAATLYIVTAQIRELQDGSRADLNGIAGHLPDSDPSHPVNGSIPPRRVLQQFGAALSGARGADNAVLPLAQKIMETPSGNAPLRPIRFRRTWKKRPNNSRYFPAHEVMIEDGQSGALLFRGRIPHHGVVYYKAAFGSAAGAQIRLKILGGMRCLKGDDDTQLLWREKATADELTYDVGSAGPLPEVILRRPMSEEIFTEPTQRTDGAACSYHSLRRSLRAPWPIIASPAASSITNRWRTNRSQCCDRRWAAPRRRSKATSLAR